MTLKVKVKDIVKLLETNEQILAYLDAEIKKWLSLTEDSRLTITLERT